MDTMWRLLPPVDGPGSFHMAADVAIREAIHAGQSGPTLRFYRWTPACVTLGRFQPAENNVHLENCARLGIDVAKRPTGGRAIYHDNEVTFSIIISEKDLPEAGSGIMDSYRVLGRALVDGLCRLDLDAELIDRHAHARAGDPPSVSSTGNPACFAAKARCDLMVQGRKIIGSAQQRKDGIILQQNSLPLAINFPVWDEVFFRSDWESVARSGAVDLWSAAERNIPYDDVVAAICEGFESSLGIKLTRGRLSVTELLRTAELAPDFSVMRVRDEMERVGARR